MGKNVLETANRAPSSQDRKGPLKVTPEGALRQKAIDIIQLKSPHAFNSLLSLYSSLGSYPTPQEVQQALLTGLTTAYKSNRWANNEQGINMGHYSDARSFYTSFFHETGHYTLTKFGRDISAYEQDPLPEEIFCWSFAERLSTILDLPFSQKQADIDMQIVSLFEQIKKTGGNQALFERLDELVKEEAELKGFSEYGAQGTRGAVLPTVAWTHHGRPQLV